MGKSLTTFPCSVICSVLFIGISSAQNVQWIKPPLIGIPPARCCAAMAYDAAMGATILFGGSTYSTTFGDTWSFSRAGWKQLSPLKSPPAMTGPGMAYDPITKTVVLFGGFLGGNTESNQTWTWDGVTWTQQFPPISPSGRSANSNFMVYDGAVGKVLLFGAGTTTTTFNDTWEWDGITKTWTEKFPAHSPSPRAAPLAYDELTKQVVLFGGNAAGYQLFGDTWTYDGLNWTQQQPATSPTARSENALAYDPFLKRVVLFGGLAGPCEDCGETRLNDTWVWGGVNWTQVQTSFTPSPRSGLSFDFDASLHGMVIFGGWITDFQFTSTTWYFGF